MKRKYSWWKFLFTKTPHRGQLPNVRRSKISSANSSTRGSFLKNSKFKRFSSFNAKTMTLDARGANNQHSKLLIGRFGEMLVRDWLSVDCEQTWADNRYLTSTVCELICCCFCLVVLFCFYFNFIKSAVDLLAVVQFTICF